MLLFDYSYNGRLARASNLSLTIHSVNEADKGIYQCIVTKYDSNSLNDRVEGQKIHVIVHFRPFILAPKQGIEDEFHFMNLGQPFSYECKIQSLPPAEIYWTKDDHIISSTANLSFPILKPEHQGTYTCVAVNVDGTEKSKLRLALSRLPIIDTILENKTVVEGESVNWNCKAHAIPNNITYEWLFEGSNIKKQEIGLRTKWINEGEIEIKKISKNDKGMFTCIVHNGIQEPVKMNIFLDVLYKPFLSKNVDDGSNIKTIIEGNDDKIECNFDSNPPIHQVIWRKNGIVLSNNSQSVFNIDNANENDSGIYSCQGLNVLGHSLPYETHIIIISLPRFTKIPPPKFSINRGDTLILECDGFASPPPLQYWLRNGKKIYSPKIVIERVGHEDHGIYECVLSNQNLAVRKKTEVFVKNVKPQPCSSVKTDCQFHPKVITTIHWIPGFNGGKSQTFKIYWRSENSDHWFTTEPTTNFTATFDDFNKFTEYEVKIESQNMYGKVISSPFKIYSCSILIPPQQIDFLEKLKVLHWKKVGDAEKYKISYRTEKMNSFITLSIVSQNNYTLPEFFKNHKNIQMYVQSLRLNYQDSVPSTIITINSTTISCTLLFTLLFGGIILFILVFFIFIYKKKCVRIFKNLTDSVYINNKVPTENINQCNMMEESSCGSKSSWNFQQLPCKYINELQSERIMMNNRYGRHFFTQQSNDNTLSSKANREWLLDHIKNINHRTTTHSTSSSSLHTLSHQFQIPCRDIPPENMNDNFYKELYNQTNYISQNYINNPHYNSSKTVLTETPVIAMMKDKYINSCGTVDSLNYLQELRVKQLKHEYNQNNTTFVEENEF
uniref:Down syndrome cell adhesion molecule-like protein Dscam2 n=1 Tax=Strongyloides venezuelensis TaxID=75913 RepID=A0A0K0G4P3_STRVS